MGCIMADTMLYRGRRTTAGNSDAFRFDKQLFRQHPEFNGPVRAHVLSRGVLLVVAEQDAGAEAAMEEHEDPMLAAWLGFIGQDHASLADMPEGRLEHLAALTEGVSVDDDEELDVDL